MKHLTVDEIIDFVSMTELNNEAIQLSGAVNGHVRKCEKCLNLVRAFQMIYDEFSERNMRGHFKTYAAESIARAKIENNQTIEIDPAMVELDCYKS